MGGNRLMLNDSDEWAGCVKVEILNVQMLKYHCENGSLTALSRIQACTPRDVVPKNTTFPST